MAKKAQSRAVSRSVRQARTGDSSHTLIRIVIASYFIAMSVGLVPGLNADVLTTAVLDGPVADYAAHGLVFALAFSILIGVAIRPAALVLALVLFWASFVSMVTVGFSQALGAFWHDLALVGALILTARDAEAGRGLFRYVPDVRKIRLGQTGIRPRRIVSETAKPVAPPVPAATEPARVTPLIPIDRAEKAAEAVAKRAAG